MVYWLLLIGPKKTPPTVMAKGLIGMAEGVSALLIRLMFFLRRKKEGFMMCG
jgi:hypothetical protein